MNNQSILSGFRAALLGLIAWGGLHIAAHAADYATVNGLKYDAERDYIVISGDQELHPRISKLDHPDRVIIDIPNTHLPDGVKPLGGIPGSPITRVRIGQFQTNTTRVVLDLARDGDFQAIASGSDIVIPIHQATGNASGNGTVAPSSGSGAILQHIVFNQGDLTFALNKLASYWTHVVPGSPFRYVVVFPRTRTSAEIAGNSHAVNASGILRWRAYQVGADTRVDVDLIKPIQFEAVATGSTWHFYTERGKLANKGTASPLPNSKPTTKPSLAPKPTAKPIAIRPTPNPQPAQTAAPVWANAPDAPLAMRKVGDVWQIMISADGRIGFKTQAIGDDRIRVDLAGGRVSLPRDSVYIDNGLIARVRVAPGVGGNQRLTIDLDQPIKHSAHLMANQRALQLTLGRQASNRVTVDAGHGGSDTGTIGQKGVREKDVTLAIATKLAAVMKANGISVQMTRMKDLEVLLRPRVEMANHNDSDVFISIHANSFGNQHGVEGIETYYFNDDSYPLAKAIHRQLLTQLKQPDRGIRKNNFYVVHHTQMPAALVEIGYLSNAHEESLLASSGYQDKAARAIYAGIKDFMAEKNKARP